jgi:two-component system, OmpR family, phosphate regulon sensor histidine kinase PhoR
MKKQTSIFFYLLGLYVVLQFSWWGYHLIDLTQKIETENQLITKRVIMIIGEGIVFFSILLFGFLKIKSSIKKELVYSERQKNFLLSVTHELKTPLAANKLYLQTILKHELEAEKRNELVNKAISENKRLEKMVDNILNASRIENKNIKLHIESFQLDELIHRIVLRFSKLGYPIFENIEESILLSADIFMIETIINNLVENALKYGGTATSIEVYCKRNNNTIIFGVKDTGPGVDTSFQKDMFQKFVRSGNEETRTQKGTGLGLFIVSEFVKIHRGTINYKENSPQGANFEITLRWHKK